MTRRPGVGGAALAMLLLSGCAATGDKVVALDSASAGSPVPTPAQAVVPVLEPIRLGARWATASSCGTATPSRSCPAARRE